MESVFKGGSVKSVVDAMCEEICALYLADSSPWVVGYSGGKDSTAVLQLVWMSLQRLAPEQRKKIVHVISTDTLVENPIVALWVEQSLKRMKDAATEQDIPIIPHRLTPEVKDTFWVNLIGKGYASPRPMFRWCTERLKIKPSNKFILDVVRAKGEVIMVLGTRKAESTARAARMKALEAKRVRDRLSPNQSLPGSLVYSPVEDWTNDDVWVFLMQHKNPWGHPNKSLLTMYQGASSDGECPLVVDTTTPSCGSSRFGCWTCTLVEKDKSMEAMIQNDEEKEWMLPLLELRNALDMRDENNNRDDRVLRDFRRMSGRVELYSRGYIPGPYIQTAREEWLRRLLSAQMHIRAKGPEEVRNISLITLEEMHEIRRIWINDKHEIEDNLPRIYRDVTGEPFPGSRYMSPTSSHFGPDEVAMLKDACGGDQLQFELLRELIAVEGHHKHMLRRQGLFESMEKAFKRNAYDGVEDAVAQAARRREVLDTARSGDMSALGAILSRLESDMDGADDDGADVPDAVVLDSPDGFASLGGMGDACDGVESLPGVEMARKQTAEPHRTEAHVIETEGVLNITVDVQIEPVPTVKPPSVPTMTKTQGPIQYGLFD